MNGLQDFISNAMVQYVLLFAALVLVVYLARLLEAKRAESIASGKAQVGNFESQVYWFLDQLAERAVKYVEQLWISSQIDKDARRDAAVKYINDALAANGITNLPTNEIIVAVEKAIHDYLNTDKVKTPSA